jgi:murein DD-endopeptidase MepM/ murein hydrolase activator NlpD
MDELRIGPERNGESASASGTQVRRPGLRFEDADPAPVSEVADRSEAAPRIAYGRSPEILDAGDSPVRTDGDSKRELSGDAKNERKHVLVFEDDVKRVRAHPDAVGASVKAEGERKRRPSGDVKRRRKHVLVFDDDVKRKRPHIKALAPARHHGAAIGAALAHIHKEIGKAEDENVGVEAAHKSGALIERGLKVARDCQKAAPQSRTARPLNRTERLRTGIPLRGARTKDKGSVSGGAFRRMVQKRKIRRGYAKAVRSAGKAVLRTNNVGSAAAVRRGIVSAIKGHPAVLLIVSLIVLLVVILMTSFSSCSNMASGALGLVASSSYLAPDTDIENAELSYTEWETDLRIEAMGAESVYPGYDEYRYSIDDMGHDPHALMAYLTAAYDDFSYSDIAAALRGVFGSQYSLTHAPVTETRYRTVTRTDPVTGESYQEAEAYEWHILSVTLTARSFTDVVTPGMSAEQLQRYAVIRAVKGNRQYVDSPFSFNWLPYMSDGYGWRIHPQAGNKDCHKGVDIAVPAGTKILAAHDGVVTLAENSGGYGLTVVLDGISRNGSGITTKYAHCSQLFVTAGQEVKKGDVIAKVGSTGDAAAPHLHFEFLLGGNHLNPVYFAFTNDDGSSYKPPGTPGGAEIPPYPGAPMGDERFAAMMEEAKKHLGKPYVFGASGPNSFDCSGFVCYVINHSGAGNVGRTSAQGLYNLCTPVAKNDARPGDLIFFTGTYDSGHPVTHIGIYIGNGQMIHAGKPVQYASIEAPYYKQHFYAFGRLS